jgi:hypothetical protein
LSLPQRRGRHDDKRVSDNLRRDKFSGLRPKNTINPFEKYNRIEGGAFFVGFFGFFCLFSIRYYFACWGKQ